MKKIVIQGVEGSFHDIAARSYFGDVALDLVAANSFGELFEKFSTDHSIDHAVMAIENTIAGSIMYNYSLLQNSTFHITGEVLLRIKQNLLALPGTQLEDITEVHSHPMALAQCLDFLDKTDSWKKVESEDTALSAELITRDNKIGIAAIASELAGEVHGLELIEEGIETNKRNFTRFLILSRNEGAQFTKDSRAEKASVCFSLKHEKGSLSSILTLLAEKSCNLTKIQSVPIIGKEWQYYFFADFILENNSFESIIEILDKEVASLHVLGHYKKGLYHDS